MTPERTNVCPGCGYEYESWVEVCPDCNLPVELRPVGPARDGVDRGGDPEWMVVANVPNAIIGNLIKSQLEDADIPVLMMRSPSADIAEFSHNDYVPQDIRVPRHLAVDARRIIDSPPDMQSAEWGAENESDPDVREEGESYGLSQRKLSPQGWRVLPHHTPGRSSREAASGWYWADEEGAEDYPVAISQVAEDEYPRAHEPYERGEDYYGDEPYRSPNWIRIFYGILLAAISLPFILQLIQQITAVFGVPHR